MNIVDVLSGDWWEPPWGFGENLSEADPPEPDPNEPENVVVAARLVLRMVYEFCGTHPHFIVHPKEQTALYYLADDAGVEWTLPTITSR